MTSIAAVAATATVAADTVDSRQHQVGDVGSVNNDHQTPTNPLSKGRQQLQDVNGFSTPSPKRQHLSSPIQDQQQVNCHNSESHDDHPTEEFDDEGNVVRVENLVFIEGVLGQGAFGTVRLARRKLNHHPNYYHSHSHQRNGEGGGGSGGGSSSNSSNGPTSVATTPVKSSDNLHTAPPMPSVGGTRHGRSTRRQNVLSKSRSEPKHKSSFFETPVPPPTQPESEVKVQSQEESQNKERPRDSPTRRKSSGADSTSSDRPPSRSLSPTPAQPSIQPAPSSPTFHSYFHPRHRTTSTPIGQRHGGRWFQGQYHHHHSHGRHSPGNFGLFPRSRSSMNHAERCDYDDEQLVAVKIFSKSILKRKRTMERDKSTKRVRVKTALQQVEREIALMKKLSHPNLVQMYEVIDSPESDMLYMVLEYMPGGEILSYQDDGTFRRKNPRPASQSAKNTQIDGVVDGHFDEDHAALYFVDILHGLAYLHQHHVCHRDLKPENILLDARGVAKVGDFGVSHIFEKESKVGAQRMACIDEHEKFQGNDKESGKNFSDSWSVSSSSSLEEISEQERRLPKLTRKDTDAALSMQGMAGSGMLSKTEGTWCFWSPEMCEGSQSFSGYAADMWAAGVCLYTFVTGKLPFYSEVPQELFEMIANSDIPYAGLGLSNSLVDLLKRCLEKDPNKRAGVGDCLKHPFLQVARQKRIKQLSQEFEIASKKKIVISEEDIRSAFRTVTSVPVQVLRSAGKKIQEGIAHTRDRLSISTSSITDGESLVKHFQEGIQHLRNRMPSMGSTAHSGDGDGSLGDIHQLKKMQTSAEQPPTESANRQQPSCPSKQRVVFFSRHASSDSDRSLNTFDETSPPLSTDRLDEPELVTRISRLSSGLSFGSNITDEMPTALLEEENEDADDDAGAPVNCKVVAAPHAHTVDSRTSNSHTLGHRHEKPLGGPSKMTPAVKKGTKKKRRKDDKVSKCIIQ